MPKVTLTDILSGYASAEALNDNFDTIETAFDNTLSLDGSTPNSMSAELDMNSNKIINLAAPANDNDAARKVDLTNLLTFTDTTLPAQAGNAGKYLKTDGSVHSWQDISTTPATTSTLGTVELATDAEAETGTASTVLQCSNVESAFKGILAGFNTDGTLNNYTGDTESITVNSDYKVLGTTATNLPWSDAEEGILSTRVYSTNEITQYATKHVDSKVWYKCKSAGTWDASWSVVATENYVDTQSHVVVQRVDGTPYTAHATSTSYIPFDDTIPQNTEGTEYVTVTITPTSASNYLVIEGTADLVSMNIAGYLTMSLFQDTTADSIGVTSVFKAANYITPLYINHKMVAGTTSSTTFKLRIGSHTGTMAVNGTTAARYFGGSTAVKLSVTEIAV